MSQAASLSSLQFTRSIASSSLLPNLLPEKAGDSSQGTKRKLTLFYSALSKQLLGTPYASPGPGQVLVGPCPPEVLGQDLALLSSSSLAT